MTTPTQPADIHRAIAEAGTPQAISLAQAATLCKKHGTNSRSAPYRGYRVTLDDDRAIACDPSGAFWLFARPAMTPKHEHQVTGLCPVCHHYGDDCSGTIRNGIRPGMLFRMPSHDCVWEAVYYHRGGNWVCQEPEHKTTCHFHETDIVAREVKCTCEERHLPPNEPRLACQVHGQPCNICGAWGHLAYQCTKPRPAVPERFTFLTALAAEVCGYVNLDARHCAAKSIARAAYRAFPGFTEHDARGFAQLAGLPDGVTLSRHQVFPTR